MKMARRWLCRARDRRGRGGRGRADMRPETRDLPGRHETLRPPAGGPRSVAAAWEGRAPSRPHGRAALRRGRQSLNVSCLRSSQCLIVSMSPQVSGLGSQVSLPHPPPHPPAKLQLSKIPACVGRGDVVSSSSMIRLEWQIPRSGEAEGRTLFLSHGIAFCGRIMAVSNCEEVLNG